MSFYFFSLVSDNNDLTGDIPRELGDVIISHSKLNKHQDFSQLNISH